MRVAILGAGSTGCYLGAVLKLAGCHLTLIGRDRIKKTIESNNGITITDYLGHRSTIKPDTILTDTSLVSIHEPYDVIFIMVKCHQLASSLDDLRRLSHESSVLVFMQNGLGSFEDIQAEYVPGVRLRGITPFNVLQRPNALFHKGTEGHFIFEQHPTTQQLQARLIHTHEPCELFSDMQAVVAGKLLLNLNNALNAVVDRPILEELNDRQLRKILAAAMSEWLQVLQHKSIKPHQFTKVNPLWVPFILRLPNFLFTRLAKAMLDIDPQARSSMWEDIQAGRKTEIEYLNGAVVAEAKQAGLKAPVNQAIADTVTRLESGERVVLKALLEKIEQFL